jgi:hypothetical protein
MTADIAPAVGNWYQSEQGPRFEVVDIDEDDGVVEIQYFDGELDEVSFDTWSAMGLHSIAPPEDWSAPFDEMERDDLGFTDTHSRNAGWPNVFDELDE